MHLRSIAALLLTAPIALACEDKPASADSAEPVTEIDQAWAVYEISPPPPEVDAWLNATPFLWPEQVCVPASSIENLPTTAERTVASDGTEEVCVWDAFSGNVPEGMDFTDLSTCELAWTQGPPWFAAPARQHRSDDALLDDPA